MTNPIAQRRRALGITRSRRRPGTALLAVGIALLIAAAFLVGRGESRDRNDAVPIVTTTSAPSSQAGPVAARLAAITVPEGHDGVAVTLPFAAGGGGYVAAGDRIDLHAVRPGAEPLASRVLLSDVLVLDVSAEVQPRVTSGAAERPSTGQLTYLLAVPSDQVDVLVGATQSEGLYLSLRAAGTTSTQVYGTASEGTARDAEKGTEQ